MQDQSIWQSPTYDAVQTLCLAVRSVTLSSDARVVLHYAGEQPHGFCHDPIERLHLNILRYVATV
jgi:hypothetical protein